LSTDAKFFTIWKAVGWENVDPIWEEGSRLLTIQFLCSLQEVDNGITFRLFEIEYFVSWNDLSLHLGFNKRCSIDLDHFLKGLNCHKFWGEISSQVVVGKFSPRNANIQHPALRFMHRWIAITLFPSQDIRCVRNDELKLHYAIVKKIKVAPVKEMFNHWLETFKVSTSISCTSLVTCIATNIGALEGKDVVYISTPRIINDEHYLMQGHHLKYNAAGDLVFYVPRYTNEIRLPNPQLHLYKS
jgi:hypothetical protein